MRRKLNEREREIDLHRSMLAPGIQENFTCDKEADVDDEAVNIDGSETLRMNASMCLKPFLLASSKLTLLDVLSVEVPAVNPSILY